MDQQPTEPQRQGYPIWAWIIAVLTFWPLPGMLVGRFIPKTRRFFRAPGIILSAVLLLAIPVTIGLIIPQPDPSASNAGPSEKEKVEIPSPTVVVQATECPTEAEETYLDDLGSSMRGASTLLTMFGEELIAVGDTPWKIQDTDWLYARETDIDTMVLYFDQINDIPHPPSVDALHRQAQDVVADNTSALNDVKGGILAHDIDRLERGGNALVRTNSNNIALARAIKTFCDSSTSSSESRNSTSKQQPTTAQKWYQGGTLHKETAAEWVKASDRDRLATSGDFATAALKRSIIWDDMDSLDDVRPYAEALKKCIDTTYDPVSIIPETKNAETATLCWVIMYPHLVK